MSQKFLIPADFQNKLPELKEQAFKWKMEYVSQTPLQSVGHITHYSVTDKARANIIVIPGLTSNTEIEPLMRAITYWALDNKHNVYALDTFLGDFHDDITHEYAQRNTFPEFIKLIDTGLDILEKQCAGTWTCLTAHSAGATGTFEIFNRRILDGKKLRFAACVMFAPYVSDQDCAKFRNLYRARYRMTNIPDEEFDNTPMGFTSPQDIALTNTKRYVTVYPSFFQDLAAVRMRPDIMDKYNIPITIVGAGRDNKVTTKSLIDLYNDLRQMPHGKNFKYVEFKNSKHSFEDQHRDWSTIIQLIQSQHVRGL